MIGGWDYMCRTKSILAGLLCFFLCATFAGHAAALGAGPEGAAVRIAPVTARKLEQPSYSPEESPSSTVAEGANAFAFRLGAELLRRAGDQNFLFSPFSVWMPLAALVNATAEPQRAALLKSLEAEGVGAEDMNLTASRMLYSLTKQDDKRMAADYGEEFYHDPLRIANAVFVSHDAALKAAFAQAFMDFYRGTSMNVDFGAREAADAVNRWASENTEGLITDIIQAFSPETVAAIANAIYFSDRWDWEFDPDDTEEGVFHAPQGDISAFFMLREGERLDYYEDERVQAMPLAFKTGGGLLVLLPKDGDADALLSSMTNEYFQRVSYGSDRPGKLLLPRFSIEGEVMELSGALTALGIPLFDPGAAPLTELVEGDVPIWISGALHKATITVDEKGTTAAAVTVMAMAGAAPPEPAAPFEMICDRPFAFVLYDYTYDGGHQVLFTGIVRQP